MSGEKSCGGECDKISHLANTRFEMTREGTVEFEMILSGSHALRGDQFFYTDVM